MKNMQSKWETQQKLVAGNCNQIFWFVKYLNAYKKSNIFSDSSCGSETHLDGTRLHQEQFLSFGVAHFAYKSVREYRSRFIVHKYLARMVNFTKVMVIIIIPLFTVLEKRATSSASCLFLSSYQNNHADYISCPLSLAHCIRRC